MRPRYCAREFLNTKDPGVFGIDSYVHKASVRDLFVSPLMFFGEEVEYVSTARIRTEAGIWMRSFDKYLELAVTGSKLEKHTMDDEDDLSEIPERFRSIVMLLLFYGKRRADIQSTIQWLCKRLKQQIRKQSVSYMSY